LDVLANLALGFQTALTLTNLAYCLIGTVIGTLIGVLPGLGPVATIAMLLPLTFGLPPETALIMLAGIFYGAQYGGSTTSILINVPGEASSVVTALDGYQMARKGRAGAALAAAAIGSFFAGTVATVLIALTAPALAGIALAFGPAEYTALLVLGLIASIVLAQGSILKAFGMLFVGLLLGLIGQDLNSGVMRFTLGVPELSDGIGFVIIAMGAFGISEILKNLDDAEQRLAISQNLGRLMLGRDDLRRMVAPALRGTAIGAILGVLPGGGAVIGSFAAYSIEKRISRPIEGMGNGAIEGVVAPESANNAGAQTSFIPLLTLGIPTNGVMALMVGAMIIQGIAPGPNVIVDKPALFWGLIASMWIGNLFLVILNLPLIGVWVRLLTAPYSLLYPAIVVFCAIGVLSLKGSQLDVLLLALSGVVGYVLSRLDCEPAPLLLGFVLGPLLEEYLRRALVLSRGDWTVFVTEPIAATMLAIGFVAVAIAVLPMVRKSRDKALASS
jgi:TctA family transporter